MYVIMVTTMNYIFAITWMKNPCLQKEYEDLKLELWKQYEHDRDGYTEAKTDFVKRIYRTGKKRICGRYE